MEVVELDIAGGLDGYTTSNPFIANSRDHILGKEFELETGATYRVFVTGQRIAGDLPLNGGIWYTGYTSGAPYDGYGSNFTSLGAFGSGWKRYYKDITIDPSKNKGRFYIQLEQGSSGGSTTWRLAGMSVVKLDKNVVRIDYQSRGDRYYIANWSPVNYGISYNLKGGSASNPGLYNIETGSFTLQNPSLSGWNFSGWTGTNLGGATMSVTIPNGSTGDRSYTANYYRTVSGSGGASYNRGDGRNSCDLTSVTLYLNDWQDSSFYFAGNLSMCDEHDAWGKTYQAFKVYCDGGWYYQTDARNRGCISSYTATYDSENRHNQGAWYADWNISTNAGRASAIQIYASSGREWERFNIFTANRYYNYTEYL